MSAKLRPDRMQALLAAGFSDLPFGEFLLLTVCRDRAQHARKWLFDLLESDLIASVDHIGRRAGTRRLAVATVAISHAGLLALGIQPSPTLPFPSIFRDGMGDPTRSVQLGDADVASWRWSDSDRGGASQQHLAHLLVARYRVGEPSPMEQRLFDSQRLAGAGFKDLRIPVDPDHLSAGVAVEAFGFRDGMAQPFVAGIDARIVAELRDADPARKAALEQNLLATGEFVLGHQNQYGDKAYAPDVTGWNDPVGPFGQDGTYIAVRQILQDRTALDAFESAFELKHPSPCGAPTVFERMVGRRRGGSPLCPHDPENPESFGFRIGDGEGFGCPRGAHIRRANPRDMLSLDVESGSRTSKLHRLLRRGRSYLLEKEQDKEQERGMFFMALNADLDRQFAFVQQRWISNPGFGGLSGESDPLLGQTHRAFTIQQSVVGKRVTGLPRFTRVVGGGYFLMLSLPALIFIART